MQCKCLLKVKLMSTALDEFVATLWVVNFIIWGIDNMLLLLYIDKLIESTFEYVV